jgi:hypothetical protein
MQFKNSNSKNLTNPIKSSQKNSSRFRNLSLNKNLPWKSKNRPHQGPFGTLKQQNKGKERKNESKSA